jgi:hypothetical protein
VGVLQEAIEHGVGNGRIADRLVPVGDRELRTGDGRTKPVTVFHDPEQVGRLLGVAWPEEEVVQDGYLHSCAALNA